MATEYNYTKRLANYEKIVTDRGYNFFSKESYKDYEEKYGNRSYGDIHNEIEAEVDYNLKIINDGVHPLHTSVYNEFKNRHGGGIEKMRDMVKNKHYEKNGKLKEQNPRFQNKSYEDKVLRVPANATIEQCNAYNLLNRLMKAKWRAVGYSLDEEEIREFKNHYGLEYTEKKEHKPEGKVQNRLLHNALNRFSQ